MKMMKLRTHTHDLAIGLSLALLAGLLPGRAEAQDPDLVLPELEAYEVGKALPPTEDGRELVEFSLQDAIDRALEANLNIQSARLNPQIQRYNFRSAGAAFTPNFSTNLNFNRSTNQSTSQLDGGSTTTNERITWNSSLNKPFRFFGSSLSASMNNSRSETNSAFTTRNPSFSSSFSLNFTQPLLAGFKIDNQRASLQTQQIQNQITDLQLEQQIEQITAQVREQYWGLRSAIEQIEIQRQNLAQAQETLQQTQVRLQAGQGTPYQVIQNEAQVASAEQALLNAEINWRNTELAFKQLLMDGARDPLLNQTINPTQLPEVVDRDVDIDAAIETALESRVDLRTQRQQLDIAEVNLEVNETNALPTLDLTASYSVSGVGGDLFERGELGGDPVLAQEGGFGDAIQSILDRDAPTWSFGLNGSYPIGANSQKLTYERAEIQLRQQQIALNTQELNIVTQVTSAGLAVRNTFLQYQAAVRNREAAEQNARSELARLQVGVATNFEVVQAQDQLTAARLSELQALISHVNAIADFDQVQRIGN